MRRFAIGVVIAVAACSLPSVGLWSAQGKADTGLYGLYGNRIAHGHVPYRSGFAMEFPPGAIPPLAVPALPHSHYVPWFHAFELLCLLAAIGAVAYATTALVPVLAAAVSPALLGPITLNSFDLWPAALAAWATALVVRGRPRLGFTLLGIAVAAKLYPVLLVPALLPYLASRFGTGEVKRAFAVGAAVVAAVFLPFVALAPGGLKFSLQEQATRGLQVESLGGSILGVAHRLGAGFHTVVSSSPFSFDIGGGIATALATGLSFVALLAAGVAWWLLLRQGPIDVARTLRTTATSAVAFVAFAKVLSPQYLLFLVPLVPLVESAAATALLLLALGLTQIWARFPEPFLRTVHLGPGIWAVLARNVVLVALYVSLAVGLRRRRTTIHP